MAADMAALAIPIPDYPDFSTWQTALTNCDDEFYADWDDSMGRAGKQITYVFFADRLPRSEALCPVHVRVPLEYNWMTATDERVARLWVLSSNGSVGVTGNTIAFPIPTVNREGDKNFTDFVFTNIAVVGPAGRYRFIFQLMMKGPTGWILLAKLRSTQFDLGNRVSYDFVQAQTALNLAYNRSVIHAVNIDPTEVG